jgi:hypothetical protein
MKQAIAAMQKDGRQNDEEEEEGGDRSDMFITEESEVERYKHTSQLSQKARN